MALRISLLLSLMLSLSLALALKEVPLVNVSLSGGPENRQVTLGVNFDITCNYSLSSPAGEVWRPQMTFYKDGAQLGRFELLEKSKSKKVYWNTVTLIPGMNVYSASPVSATAATSYTVQIQPLSYDAQGRYGCSVLLEDEHFTKARFFSNPLDIRPPPFPGAPQGARRQPPPPPPQPPVPQPPVPPTEPKKDL